MTSLHLACPFHDTSGIQKNNRAIPFTPFPEGVSNVIFVLANTMDRYYAEYKTRPVMWDEKCQYLHTLIPTLNKDSEEYHEANAHLGYLYCDAAKYDTAIDYFMAVNPKCVKYKDDFAFSFAEALMRVKRYTLAAKVIVESRKYHPYDVQLSQLLMQAFLYGYDPDTWEAYVTDIREVAKSIIDREEVCGPYFKGTSGPAKQVLYLLKAEKNKHLFDKTFPF